MKALVKRGLPLILMVILGIVLSLGDQALSWSIDDPEIKDLSDIILVRSYEGSEEFSLQFTYLNERSMNYIWDFEAVETVKKMIGDRNCLFLVVFVKQDSYFYPTSITFVQEELQYEIGYDDVVKVSDTFSGRLRAGVKVFGLVFIPERIDMYSPMKIYYDEDYTTFSVPKEEEKELDIKEQIEKLEEERVELEYKIEESRKRIDEIDRKLEEIRKQGRIEEKISLLSTLENTVKTYYEVVFIKQDESLARNCYSKETSSLLVETIRSPTEIKKALESKGVIFEDYTKKILTATYSIDKDRSEESADPENERLVEVEFNDESLSWKVVKEDGEWKIAMPVAVTKEQGEIWLKSTPEIQPFSNLSTPEDTLRSFMEATCLGDKETAKGYWSSRMPETSVESLVDVMMKELEDTHPEFIKFLVRATRYGSEKINEDNYYAFTIPPGSKKRSKTIVLRVTRENDYWKILVPKKLEDDPSLSILMELLGID